MRRCDVIGATGCDHVTSVQFGEYGGLPGDSQSSAALAMNGYGAGNGSVSLSGAIGAPILKASANSESAKRVSTNSIALQRYQYNGATPTTRTFGGTISYSQHSTGLYPIGTGSGIAAYLEVFKLPTSTISVDPSSVANFNLLIGGYASLNGYVSLGDATFQDKNSTTSGIGNLGVTVQLNPGDAIWVWALVQTPATNGGWIDSSHTFVTAWNETSNLTPSVVAVPEPGTFVLLAFGAAFLFSISKVRKQRLSN